MCGRGGPGCGVVVVVVGPVVVVVMTIVVGLTVVDEIGGGIVVVGAVVVEETVVVAGVVVVVDGAVVVVVSTSPHVTEAVPVAECGVSPIVHVDVTVTVAVDPLRSAVSDEIDTVADPAAGVAETSALVIPTAPTDTPMWIVTGGVGNADHVTVT